MVASLFLWRVARGLVCWVTGVGAWGRELGKNEKTQIALWVMVGRAAVAWGPRPSHTLDAGCRKLLPCVWYPKCHCSTQLLCFLAGSEFVHLHWEINWFGLFLTQKGLGRKWRCLHNWAPSEIALFTAWNIFCVDSFFLVNQNIYVNCVLLLWTIKWCTSFPVKTAKDI